MKNRSAYFTNKKMWRTEMKRTILRALSVILVLLLTLAACTPASSTSTAENTAPSSGNDALSVGAATSGETVKLKFWHSLTGHNGEGLQKMVDDFNASQSAIQVEAVFQGNYYESAAKLQAALISGSQPDLIMLEVALVGQFASANVLVDFAQHLSADEVANFQEGLLKDTYVNDTLAAIPFNRSTPVLYVNRDMLKQAGLDPAGPKTWDELRSFSKTIIEKIPGTVGCEIPVDVWFFESGMFQQDGSVLTDDLKSVNFVNEKGENTIRFWQEMIDEGSMKSPVGKDYNGWDAAMADFVGQKAAMITVSTGYLKGLLDQTDGVFDMGTCFLPAYTDGKYATPTGGANIAILNKSSEEEINASVEFIRFLTNKENVGFFCEWTGYVPTTKEALEYPGLKALYEKYPQYLTAVDHLQYAQKRSIIKGYREMAVIIQEEIRAALLDTQIPPKRALENAAEQIQVILDDE